MRRRISAGTFGVNRLGWAPTVQLTAYLRAVPVDGWLRVLCTTMQIESRLWLDEDHVVVDANGNSLVQSRQLAMVPAQLRPDPSRSVHSLSRDPGVRVALTTFGPCRGDVQCFPAWRESPIIGGGSIGEALLSGLLKGGRQAKDLAVAEKDPARAKHLSSEQYSVLLTSVADAAENASYVIVAVKPADVDRSCSIADAFAEAHDGNIEQVIVSVAAGVSTAYYESRLPAGSPVIRVMPNPRCWWVSGCRRFPPGTSRRPSRWRTSPRSSAWLARSRWSRRPTDAVTAVSGSGPCFFRWPGAGRRSRGGGLADVATELVAQTMAGSAAMLLDRLEARGGWRDDDRPVSTPPRSCAPW